MKYTIGLALVHFKWTDLVNQVVNHIAKVHGIQHAEAEIDRELETGLARRGFNSIAVFEQEHAESVEAGILQCETILSFVHSKAAGTTRAGRKENEVIENLLARHAFFF